jgi:hypothetical protein
MRAGYRGEGKANGSALRYRKFSRATPLALVGKADGVEEVGKGAFKLFVVGFGCYAH